MRGFNNDRADMPKTPRKSRWRRGLAIVVMTAGSLYGFLWWLSEFPPAEPIFSFLEGSNQRLRRECEAEVRRQLNGPQNIRFVNAWTAEKQIAIPSRYRMMVSLRSWHSEVTVITGQGRRKRFEFLCLDRLHPKQVDIWELNSDNTRVQESVKHFPERYSSGRTSYS
ncbi:hypothetical protein [Deinococcus hopiensis]|uniref:Uncharacterized protein n=1 Tax=Deinococcus hopiensis KR-140 TaxID=695939 RepID=A0A1W1VWD8_9DEIO|nr:hypothetical protein [Deinococcus hopiensis]SMB97194.1 hypothetical protein SAMN00790413_06405 [Deinococcus hopiensis KR-140]